MNAILIGLVFAAWASDAATRTEWLITRYGARQERLCTKAIQKAVDACAAAGGGKVVIPAGRFVSGPIFLKSHVQIELGAGAVLLASTNIADYPAVDGRWEGIERKIYASLFTGRNLEGISITGRGTIDGRGSVWWAAHKQTSALRKERGLLGREPENPPEAPLRWPRPRMIYLQNCTNVLLRDVTILNSPSWHVHPVYCQNVTLDNLTIEAPDNSPNTDAVDPDSCHDVRISNCHFDVGDDCVVIKSGYNADGRRVGLPCEDILVSNCTFGRGHGGVVIGSEMSGSVRNVVVANCVFDGTQRGLRVKTALGRGGVVENFRASNLVMRNIVEAAFSITSTYADSQSGPSAGAAEAIPALRHFHWSDVLVSGAERVAELSGLAEAPLEDFSLRNVAVTETRTGIRCANAKDVRFEAIQLPDLAGPAVELRDVDGAEIAEISVPRAEKEVMAFTAVSGARVRDCRVAEGEGVLVRQTGTKHQKVTSSGNQLPAGVKEQEP